ncbi:hypothetical protein [Methylobacterium bullatum]|uniref:Uncharacterized protein n=1 Tax=Methylobacterium bullatum TaxID=570505 RepID=A0A679K7P3_9HYPH|nr:hypothetical protein MBLL_04747 [Methylobacterium bullatum]
MNLALPSKPAATGTALQGAAYAEAFAAGVAAERAKWVAAGAALSLIGEHTGGETLSWDAIAADLNAAAGVAAKTEA